jgi:hypothetical protein
MLVALTAILNMLGFFLHRHKNVQRDRLHTRLTQMSDRIEKLEQALDEIHSETRDSQEKHPLLSPPALLIKSMQDLYENMASPFYPTPSPSSTSDDALGERSVGKGKGIARRPPKDCPEVCDCLSTC